jgi:hypothetical protein
MSKQDQCFFAEVDLCIQQSIFKCLPIIPTALRGCVCEEGVQVLFGHEHDGLEIVVTVFFGWDGYYSEGFGALINYLPWVKQDRQQQTAKHYLHFDNPIV